MKQILTAEKGRKEIFHYSAHDDTAAIESVTDVAGILKANKFQRDTQTMKHESDVFNHKARIPIDAINHWCKMKGIKYGEFMGESKHLKAFLNSVDNKHWLTRTGKV